MHAPIIEAFEKGDAKLAAKLLRKHSLAFAAEVAKEKITQSRKGAKKKRYGLPG
jgi:DNA-binding GntR family transcriptional regulator